MNELTPQELVAKFSRCMRYPIDIRGINDLADGLESASKTTGVSMEDIVVACLPLARYCPTDAEMLTIARNLREDRKREAESNRDQRGEWERNYGKPQPYDWNAENEAIMAQSREHWKRDAEMIRRMKSWAASRNIKPKDIPIVDWMRKKIEVQREVGIPVTPEQCKLAGVDYR